MASKFVEYDDWFDYIFESLIENGFVVDEELIDYFIRASVDFLEEKEIISGTIEIGYDE